MMPSFLIFTSLHYLSQNFILQFIVTISLHSSSTAWCISVSLFTWCLQALSQHPLQLLIIINPSYHLRVLIISLQISLLLLIHWWLHSVACHTHSWWHCSVWRKAIGWTLHVRAISGARIVLSSLLVNTASRIGVDSSICLEYTTSAHSSVDASLVLIKVITILI